MRPIARQSARLANCSRIRQSQASQNGQCEQRSPFSTSTQRKQEPRSPGGSSDSPISINERRELHEKKTEHGVARREHASEQEHGESRGANDAWTYARKRSLRQKSGQDVPKPPTVPEWFLKHNVRLYRDFPGKGVTTEAGEVIRCIDTATGHTLFSIPFYDAWPDDPATAIERESKIKKDGRANDDQLKGSEITSPVVAQTSKPAKDASQVQQPNSMQATGSANVAMPEMKSLLLRHPNYDPARWSFLEAESAIRAALSLAGETSTSSPASLAVDRVDLSLQFPGPDASNQMDRWGEDLAKIVEADLIRLDVNDFAELSQDYIGNGSDEPGSISTLAYDVYDGYDASNFGAPQARSSAKAEEEDEEDEVDASESNGIRGNNVVLFGGTIDLRKLMQMGRVPAGNNVRIEQHEQSGAASQSLQRSRIGAPDSDLNNHDQRITLLLEQLLDVTKQQQIVQESWAAPEEEASSGLSHRPLQESELETVPNSLKHIQALWKAARGDGTISNQRARRRRVEMHQARARYRSNAEMWFPRTASAFVNHLVEAVRDVDILDASIRLTSDARSTMSSTEAQKSNGIVDSTEQAPSKSIVHIRDLRDMCDTPMGEKIVHHLVNLARKRRREGQQIVIVGTTAQDVQGPHKVSGEHADVFPFLSLTVPPIFNLSRSEIIDFESVPPMSRQQTLDSPEYLRIAEINLRHIQSMLRRLRPQDQFDLLSPEARGQLNLPGTNFLTKTVLSIDEVQQLVLIAIGLSLSHTLANTVHPIHIALAAFVHGHASYIARHWTAYMEKKEAKGFYPNESRASTPHSAKENSDAKMERLKKICSPHEVRLLHGMVDPQNIKTTFKDVHAPVDTLDALKDLTTLSFLRPEAFTYGVLANDRLPGLLLYGPPGTGKTLLAKAVAKESNATVLEVSGAQIYEKYVGEGEKMVQAVFSLAKKLSPCVVFIDEADAIFGSRSRDSNRTSHRQIINQFLREWDGMDDHSVFMMVATNRPFDLDDAVLRRLPRRLLVDLPVAKDRESILGIHLKDEKLDANVSLAQLAEQTPLYSGSDLKNLAVAAALACVREENELAATKREDKEFKLPEKRTLNPEHFEKALAEISASINEDMSSLNAVRKFDEQYGDRKGRRKKKAYGFGSADEAVNEELARVRQSSASSEPPRR